MNNTDDLWCFALPSAAVKVSLSHFVLFVLIVSMFDMSIFYPTNFSRIYFIVDVGFLPYINSTYLIYLQEKVLWTSNQHISTHKLHLTHVIWRQLECAKKIVKMKKWSCICCVGSSCEGVHSQCLLLWCKFCLNIDAIIFNKMEICFWCCKYGPHAHINHSI